MNAILWSRSIIINICFYYFLIINNRICLLEIWLRTHIILYLTSIAILLLWKYVINLFHFRNAHFNNFYESKINLHWYYTYTVAVCFLCAWFKSIIRYLSFEYSTKHNQFRTASQTSNNYRLWICNNSWR